MHYAPHPTSTATTVGLPTDLNCPPTEVPPAADARIECKIREATAAQESQAGGCGAVQGAAGMKEIDSDGRHGSQAGSWSCVVLAAMQSKLGGSDGQAALCCTRQLCCSGDGFVSLFWPQHAQERFSGLENYERRSGWQPLNRKQGWGASGGDVMMGSSGRRCGSAVPWPGQGPGTRAYR